MGSAVYLGGWYYWFGISVWGGAMSERPDADTFETGSLYRHDYTGDVAEFLGTALMPELDGEDVCLFRWVDGSGFIVATNHSWAYGETFTRLSDGEVSRIA